MQNNLAHIHEDHIKLSTSSRYSYSSLSSSLFLTSWIYVNFNLSDVKKLRLGPKGARRMASTMLGDSNGTSVGSLYTRVMVDLRDPRYDKTWQRDKDIPKNVFKMKVLRMLMIFMMDHSKKIWL